MKIFIPILAVVLVSGCAQMPQRTSFVPEANVARAEEFVATSLFPADQAVLSDEAVARILSSKLELPEKAKLALMRFPESSAWGSRYYGNHYWRDEKYLKFQQEQVETISKTLMISEQVVDVSPLPSLMTPRQLSIPLLREAALRMQADLLLVFRVGSDTYSQYRTFGKDKVKSYSTCEMVLLDVRTGLAPFTRVVSRERLEVKQSTDLDLSETMRRAEETSAVEALKVAAEALVHYIKSVPKRGA